MGIKAQQAIANRCCCDLKSKNRRSLSQYFKRWMAA